MKLISATIIGLSAACWAAACRADEAPVSPVHTNKPRFGIPFQSDRAELERLGAREIRLYGSVDRGANWQHLQSVPPEAGRFQFTAAGDGEYWFAVRTVDAHGRLHPDGSGLKPGLRVVVDTNRPSLELVLRQPEAGKVGLAWTASDPYLDASTLQMEYTRVGLSSWKRVVVSNKDHGETSWSCPEGGLMAVRGRVADRAGNFGSAETQLSIAPSQRTAPTPAGPDFSQPVAFGSPPDASNAIETPEQFGSPNVESLPAPSSDRPSIPLAMNPLQPFVPAPNETGPPNGSSGPGLAIVPGNPGQFVADGSRRRPNAVGGDSRAAEDARPQQAASNGPRIVNSREFQVGYAIEDVGPSGVGSVELFITQNGGQKWYRYGTDPDRSSPFEVVVPQEGTYGFSLRVRSGAGLAAKPPQPGEPPEVVVAVDQTAPKIEVLPVEQGRGASVNKLLVRWKIEDAHPAERPIGLSFAGTPGGPWQPIGDWRADQGNFIWTVEPGMPERLYIRVTARDAAGNISHAEAPEPVTVDLSRPSARIVDVEPVTSQR